MKNQIYSAIAFSVAILLMPSIFNSCIQEETFSKATVETSQVTSVTEATAICGGVVTSDGGSNISVRGVCWNTSPYPTIENDTTIEVVGTGPFTSLIKGLSPSTTYYVRAYATNSVGTTYGNEMSFTTLASSGTVTDIEGNVYNYITIGTQVWMIENLKTTKYNDGTSIPNITDDTTWSNATTPGYCFYNNDVAYKNAYGALYNWDAVNTGKLAPTGWHVPTDAEWITLENYLIANGYNYDGTTTGNNIAKSLAATTDWSTSTYTGSVGYDLTKNNASGFAGLPGGYRGCFGPFYDVGSGGYWWSSTENDYCSAWYRGLRCYGSNIYCDYSSKQFGWSVRCVRDY
ncbi:MAG: fibrobacter succinogenes major paralogous domain-containing protein [Bacteroidota bacterium]|nr:fibrobacter succinogenes major paralogous domain-containing protein [Bacteroidota bacterium]